MFRSRLGSAMFSAILVSLALSTCSPAAASGSGRLTAVPAPVLPAELPQQGGVGPAGAMLSTGSATVALTFDDGPDPVHTPRLLDLLKRHRVTATFCLVGTRVHRYPSLVRRIASEGHTVCNHSWRHRRDLGKQSTEAIVKDLQDTNRAIHQAAPRVPIKYFRAPYGTYNWRLVGLAATLGMKSIYWSLDTRDWEFSKYGRGTTMVNHIVQTVQTQTRRGSIVLAHDLNKPDTVTAFGRLLPWLGRYFRVVALPT